MAFVTVEDLYGSCEVVVFESCYNNCSNLLLEEQIVVIDGRISVKEDSDMSIVANNITELKENKKKQLTLNITNLNDIQKEKLRGAIKFFSGDRNNLTVNIKQGDKITPCMPIFASEEILNEFKEIVGEENYEV